MKRYSFFFLFFYLIANLSAEGASWTPEFHMQFRQVQETAISKDASQVAYVVRTPLMDGKKSEYLNHIWIAAADGSSNYQFTRGNDSCIQPLFSPDGRWLAFLSSRGSEDGKSKNQVWVMRLQGGEAFKITNEDPGIQSFKWSPDGKYLAFLKQDPDTKEEKKEKEEKRDVILVDQKFKHSHLYMLEFPGSDEPGSVVLRLTRGDFHISSFDWSPQSDALVFAHQDDPRQNTSGLSGDISISTIPSAQVIAAHVEEVRKAEEKGDEDQESEDADEEEEDEGIDKEKVFGEVSSLIATDGVDSIPFWSPDGKWIAFQSTGMQPEPVGLSDIYLVSADGGQLVKLAETPDRSSDILGWSGDSNTVFVSESYRTTSLWLEVPIDGSEVKKLVLESGVIENMSIASEPGKLAFTHETTDKPWEVYISETDTFEPKQLSDLHKDIDLPAMGQTRLLDWQAPDGTPVEGLLTLPIDYEAGDKVPLILNIHGGPAGVYSQSFTGSPSIYLIQYFAQNGYAILRPNPRGSSGYGKEFRYANFRDWGVGDMSDVLSGVDLVVDVGIAHPERLFVMGWSYGGYMTSYAVTVTDRFRAASNGAGLPNLVSMVTTTDIPDYLCLAT